LAETLFERADSLGAIGVRVAEDEVVIESRNVRHIELARQPGSELAEV
jgi:hypothetical protein